MGAPCSTARPIHAKGGGYPGVAWRPTHRPPPQGAPGSSTHRSAGRHAQAAVVLEVAGEGAAERPAAPDNRSVFARLGWRHKLRSRKCQWLLVFFVPAVSGVTPPGRETRQRLPCAPPQALRGQRCRLIHNAGHIGTPLPRTLGDCQFMRMVWTKSTMTVASSASVISGFNSMARLPAPSTLQMSRASIAEPLRFA